MNIPEKPVSIVTGISRGYGRAVAQALLTAGWIVVGDSRDENSLVATAAVLTPQENVLAICGDINDEEHLRMLTETANSNGSLKLLVNNAGALGPSPLPALGDMPAADLTDLLGTNVVAPLRLIQLALPELVANSGVVIDVTSDAAIENYEGWGGYGTSKAALEKLTAVLAVECPGVRFYSLDPGDMRTDMHQAAFPGEDISDRDDPEVSAPAVVILAKGDMPSARYRAVDLLAH